MPWEDLDKLIDVLPMLASGRPEIIGDGFVLGATAARRKAFRVVVHSITRDEPEAVRRVLTFCHKYFLPPTFRFFSVQIISEADDTDGNHGASITVALGDYEGGELFVDGQPFEVKYNPVEYDGNLLHHVAPFCGPRRSLTFYLCWRYREIEREDASFLQSLGFRLPEDLLPRPVLGPGRLAVSAKSQNIVLVELRLAAGLAAIALGKLGWVCKHLFYETDPDSIKLMGAHFPEAQSLMRDDGLCDFSVLDKLVAEGRHTVVFVAECRGMDFDFVHDLMCAFDHFAQYPNLDCKFVLRTDLLDIDTVKVWRAVLGCEPIQVSVANVAPIAEVKLAWVRGEVT